MKKLLILVAIALVLAVFGAVLSVHPIVVAREDRKIPCDELSRGDRSSQQILRFTFEPGGAIGLPSS
jgi:hypothetical protein